ncbi:hypothetical protein VNO80_17389 [Phaseolus coccineus]|uniref:Methylenetetrahydrofolate reductase n=1 Tax=Phaseolus coccineus TaxID=3886 RepID=A0AAN9MBV4_PHACN
MAVKSSLIDSLFDSIRSERSNRKGIQVNRSSRPMLRILHSPISNANHESSLFSPIRKRQERDWLISLGAGGTTADLGLEIANKMQNIVCVDTMMHLTCTNMPVEKIDHALHTIKSNGLHNLLALRGDPSHGQDKFVQVKHIIAKYGDYFGITIAGYPGTSGCYRK